MIEPVAFSPEELTAMANGAMTLHDAMPGPKPGKTDLSGDGWTITTGPPRASGLAIEGDGWRIMAAPGKPISEPSVGGLAGRFWQAIHGQESGGAASGVQTSNAGAVGPAQILPATFEQFAKPGEDIRNNADNIAVGMRITRSYLRQFGDPARAAVAYYSGPGNVAPRSSAVPWKRNARPSRGGPSVAEYVSQVLGRMGSA